MEQQVIFKIGPDVPVMTYEKFAEQIGMSVRWVEDKVAKNEIPIMYKKGRQKPLINVAKYWQIALSQTY